MPELQRPDGMALRCASCQRTAEQVGYGFFAEPGQSPDDYVWAEEGTLDRTTGAFLCDACYIHYGMPTSPGAGWKATPPALAALRMVHPEFGSWRPNPRGDDRG